MKYFKSDLYFDGFYLGKYQDRGIYFNKTLIDEYVDPYFVREKDNFHYAKATKDGTHRPYNKILLFKIILDLIAVRWIWYGIPNR